MTQRSCGAGRLWEVHPQMLVKTQRSHGQQTQQRFIPFSIKDVKLFIIMFFCGGFKIVHVHPHHATKE